MQPELSVIIPIYNEAGHFENFFQEWRDSLNRTVSSYEIVAINDGSTDGTGRILDKIRKDNSNVRVTHQLRTGHSEAVRRGLELARGKFILILDANGRFETEDFETLWQEKGTARLVLGSRTHRLDPLSRRLTQRAITKWSSLLFKTTVSDGNISFRLIDRATLLKFFPLLPKGTESLHLAMALVIKQEMPSLVKEIRIPFRKRKYGMSSTSFPKFLALNLTYAKELLQIRFKKKALFSEEPALRQSDYIPT